MKSVQQFAQKFGYNDDYYIICDFGCRSGLKRFYVYDLNDKERIMASYCMHGSGSGSTETRPQFSNKLGSNASSLGLYALTGIGSRSLRFSHRLQVQERMTQQIKDCINETLHPQGVIVVVEAKHMCMQMRGVEKQNSITTTSDFCGAFEQAKTRQEFMNLIHK